MIEEPAKKVLCFTLDKMFYDEDAPMQFECARLLAKFFGYKYTSYYFGENMYIGYDVPSFSEFVDRWKDRVGSGSFYDPNFEAFEGMTVTEVWRLILVSTDTLFIESE